MTIEEWLKAPAKDSFGRGSETDPPYEARRSAVVYGTSAAVLACNYGVAPEEARKLMNDAFDHELRRRTGN